MPRDGINSSCRAGSQLLSLKVKMAKAKKPDNTRSSVPNQSAKLKQLIKKCSIDPRELLVAVDDFLKVYPYDVEAWFLKAQMQNALGQQRAALSSLRQLERLHAWHSGISIERAESALFAGNEKQAARYL